MADPVFVDCPADQWTLVATNVTTGQIWRAKVGVSYLHTYRTTGGVAPTDRAEGAPIFRDTEPDVEIISSSFAIDVYVYPISDSGRVRVDV